MADETIVRLSLLEQDMARANAALVKIEQSSEKYREQHAEITDKIYDRMDDMKTEFREELVALKKELETQIAAQNEILKKISDRLDGLDKWRWIVVGFATAAGYVISKLSAVFGITLK